MLPVDPGGPGLPTPPAPPPPPPIKISGDGVTVNVG